MITAEIFAVLLDYICVNRFLRVTPIIEYFTVNLILVCAKKDCIRGPAHLACLNMRPTSASILTTIRCSYMCPAHSGPEVSDESRFETEDDDLRDTTAQTGDNPNKTTENVVISMITDKPINNLKNLFFTSSC